MGFTTVPDKAAGDVFTEAMWDTYIRDNFNSGITVLLANSTLSGTAASIDLTGISQSWAHLMLIGYLRGDTAAAATSVYMRFNADSGANYDRQWLWGSAATAAAAEEFAATAAWVANMPAASAGASLFGALTVEIPHYAQADNNKAASITSGYKTGTATTNMLSGSAGIFWRSSAAISQITLTPSAGNFAAGSRVTLYGMP